MFSKRHVQPGAADHNTKSAEHNGQVATVMDRIEGAALNDLLLQFCLGIFDLGGLRQEAEFWGLLCAGRQDEQEPNGYESPQIQFRPIFFLPSLHARRNGRGTLVRCRCAHVLVDGAKTRPHEWDAARMSARPTP
jgi:hypothetical protein